MTLDEAKEAGRLSTALADLLEAIDSLDGKKFPKWERVGVAIEYEISEAGSSIMGACVVDPRLARETMIFLETRIRARLTELGVEP